MSWVELDWVEVGLTTVKKITSANSYYCER